MTVSADYDDGFSRKRRPRLRRKERIQLEADAATQSWLRRQGIAPSEPPVLRDLPRQNGLGIPKLRQAALPPRRAEENFDAGMTVSAFRVFRWVYGALHFFCGVLWDKMTGKDSEQRRAWRLRMTFEALGTTFIKFGQQLSMRLDLLPYAYTRELESMLDNVKAFPVEQAIAAIEVATGEPLDETFSAFDRDPIGSASVACVYHAVLRSGEEVAIKVRRPGIGPSLAADMRALAWLLNLSELFYMPPGFTANFIYELRTMLMEELNFVREARFGELYRRRMNKKLNKEFRFTTAPKIFFRYSSNDVLVTEYVKGIFVHEIITALETKNEAALAKLEELNIQPVILARRIQMVARYNNFENIFFHADIHPANMLIQPGNKIVLIDFGSCGSFSRRELTSWRRWYDAQSTDDVGGMAQAAMSIVEPLPPIDKDDFAIRLEALFWTDLYAIKSKHSHWSERISARLWMGFLKLCREYHIPMRLNTLRMVRASMLGDTISARLDPDIDTYKEFRHYEKGAGKRARKRICKRLRRLTGPTKWIRLETGVDSVLKLFFQVQRTVDSLRSIPIVALMGKAAHAAQVAIRVSMIGGGTSTAIALYILAQQFINSHWRGGRHPDAFTTIWWRVVSDNGWWQLFLLVVIAIAGRRIFVRLHEKSYEKQTN
jgi:ubiquinone biosynthesis protein